MRAPLNYRIARQTGSHRRLVAPGRRSIVFAYHDRRTVPPHVVRRILVKEAGLEEDEARRLL
jgi:predicted RNA binding protein YcfA (HicA-like mRNA interferase family)